MKARFLYNGQRVVINTHPIGETTGTSEYIAEFIHLNKTFYEMPLLSYLKQFNPKCFVDIGANIGNHSLFFYLNGTKEIHSFEPQKDNFALLEMNCPDTNKYNIALGDHSGMVGTLPHPLNMGATRVIEGNEVPIKKLDDFNLSPDLIKIDVEDMEVEVVRGALETIKKHKPRLVIEHSDIQHLYDTSRLLVPLGYIIKPFVEKTWEVFEYVIDNNTN